MAPPKISAPRRGKFLSAPPSSTTSSSGTNTPSSPGSKTRGKFLSKKPAGSPLHAASNAVDADNDSLDNLRDHVHTSKIAAASRRKAIAGHRDQAIKDLDEAETIVLSLLECASDTSDALSKMTAAKSKNSHGGKGQHDTTEGNMDKESFEELTAKVRSNGVGYLAGVKKLHNLLSPHASLVKAYKNNRYGGEASIDSEKQPQKSLSVVIPGAAGAVSKIVEEATSNTYAARVKKRLALERSEILKEMIRLEELEGGGGGDEKQSEAVEEDNTAGSKPAGSKRRRKK